jgi:predicted RND superfamily exporter protein
MIQLSDGKRPAGAVPAPLNLDLWLRPLFFKPRLVLAVTVIGTGLVSLGLTRLWYDYNLLNMQPADLESVKWEKELLTRNNQSAWFALSLADNPQDALARKARFLELPCVERVEEIASLFPPQIEQKRPCIERIARQLVNLPSSAPEIPVVSPAELDGAMDAMETAIVAMGNPELARPLGQLRDLIGRLSPQQYYRRLGTYQQNLAADLLTRLAMLRNAADPEPPQLTDLPQSLVMRFVGHHGKCLLKIYAKSDIWDVAAMEQFVHEVRSVDVEATGNPMQVYEAARQMKRSYQQAAWYAFVTVVFVVWLDFRSIPYTLLALIPLGTAMLQMFGLMGLLNIPLNPANMIVLPLILGIGIDNGVHIVHDLRQQTGRRYRLSASTANAVVINSLGNMVGFGSLMIASHQGLQSLGRVLTLGMGCSLLSALIMPNLFILWRNRRGGQQLDDEGRPCDLADVHDQHLVHPRVRADHATAPECDLPSPSARGVG